MKRATRNWICFAAAVLVLFFFSICLLFLQINSNEKRIVSTQNKQPPAVPLVNSVEQTQVWLVTKPEGVRIEETYEIGSKFVDNLPWGSILTGNVMQTFPAGSPFTRLLITFPSVGWLTLSHHSRRGSAQYYVQPLNTTYTPKVTQVESAGPPNTCAEPATHLPHTDFRGGDLQAAQLGAHSNPVHTNNNAECCLQCCRIPGCVYWTRTEGGECWLKGPTAVKTAAPGLNLVSGVASVAGCVNTASNNNLYAAAEAGISVEEYSSSARCVIHNATIRDTSICIKLLHPLYEAIFSEKCTNPQIPKLSFEKCTPSKYRPYSQGNRCEITVPEPVHILQRGQALSGKLLFVWRCRTSIAILFEVIFCICRSQHSLLLDSHLFNYMHSFLAIHRRPNYHLTSTLSYYYGLDQPAPHREWSFWGPGRGKYSLRDYPCLGGGVLCAQSTCGR